MVGEDVIRAKGLGVVLDVSFREEEGVVLHPAYPITDDALQARYYRARFESCRDGMWFSMALNAILIGLVAWIAWR